jgi:tRNA (cytidine56-2'-O)-methyltransferase
MKIKVLRLGHRKKRDLRLTTHVCLTARALGANEVILSGEEDQHIIDSVKDVVSRWGGSFKIYYEKNWRKVLINHKNNGYKIVHLTMYGVPVQKGINKIRKDNKILIVVGSEKVPGEVYSVADYNIAVTNQPHSEVAALAIFLHELFKGKELNKQFRNAKVKIIPSEKGKNVLRK